MNNLPVCSELFDGIMVTGGVEMFKDNDFIPRTYSIKGYKKGKSLNLRKIIMYGVYAVLILLAAATALFLYIK